MSPENGPPPHVSIVIPIYNEEGILHSAVVDLVDRLAELGFDYELILSENGSTDRTLEMAHKLAERFAQVKVLSAGEPNYGRALRNGILAARGEYVLCDEIDLCDTDFHARALALLEARDADLVVGSKSMHGSSDERPVFRRAGTVVLNGLLRLTLGFKGTDTHGLKAFRRDALVPFAQACLVEKDIFASELVIRAERGKVPIREIPVRVLEKRPPSVGLVRRIPNVLKNVARLVVAIRIKG
jgi:glycosyltransferase involved in cell wall biosynthesis